MSLQDEPYTFEYLYKLSQSELGEVLDKMKDSYAEMERKRCRKIGQILFFQHKMMEK